MFLPQLNLHIVELEQIQFTYNLLKILPFYIGIVLFANALVDIAKIPFFLLIHLVEAVDNLDKYGFNGILDAILTDDGRYGTDKGNSAKTNTNPYGS